jgi:fibronectin type 3 domain-containing protein
VTSIYAKGVDATGNASSCALIGSYTTQLVAAALATPISYVTSLGLSWSTVTGATSYNLYWSTTAGVTTSSNVLTNVVSVYTHTSRTGGTTYYYKVAAVKNGVVGALSAEVSGVPFIGTASAPSASTAAGSLTGPTNVTLTSTTLGAAIYVTTDGSTPVCSTGGSSAPVVNVSQSMTLKAITCVTNYQSSSISSFTYTLASCASNPPANSSVIEYLVVAGGGGGGSNAGGGGGAGGYRSANDFSFTNNQTYTVAVGSGGAGVALYSGSSSAANDGGLSTFAAITSAGGGAGGGWSLYAPRSGGSGGGAGKDSTPTPWPGGAGNTPSTTPAQGYAGGRSYRGGVSTCYPNGGGGGAAEAGFTDSGGAAGRGGNGICNAIAGTDTYYAGGGGGFAFNHSYCTAAVGGAGGGGYGGFGSGGGSGTVNTGGGGGGSHNANGGSGGSGIVVLRFANTNSYQVGGSVAYTATANGSWTVLRFTSGSGTIKFNPSPTITSVSVTTPSPGTSLTPSVSFTSDMAGSAMLYSDAGCSTSSISASSSMISGANNLTTNSLTANATTTIYVKATSATNNSSCALIGSYTHDNTAPVAPVIADVSRSFNAAFTTTISQGIPSDANFKEFRYTTNGVDPTCSTGTVSSSQPTSVSILAATTTLKAIACDMVNLSSAVVTSTYTFDNAAPSVSITSTTSATTNVSPIPVTITFSESVTGFIDADVTVTNATKSGFSGSGTNYTVNVTPSAQGAVTVNVAAGAAQDAAGNNNTVASELSRTYDSLGPSLTNISLASSSPSSTNFTPTVTFSNTEYVGAYLWSDSGCMTTNINTGTGHGPGNGATSANPLPDSAVTNIYIKVHDNIYNWSPCYFVGTYTTRLPAVTLSTPIRGIGQLGHTWSTATGATYNLYWATSAGVTTSSSVLTNVSQTYWHTALTGGTPYYYKIAAVKNGVVGALSNEVSAVPYSYAAPTVASISPNSGSVNGGTAVTITGTGFVSGATVSIGGVNATAVTFVSATSITATTPAGTVGAQNVVVTNPDGQIGTLTSGYTYTTPACAGDCYLEGSSPNFAQGLAVGTERLGPSGSTITLQFANGTSGFKIWREKSGTRILNATGLVGNGWQQTLTRAGTAFTGTAFTNTTHVGQIAGRSCPPNVFLNYSNMTVTNRCLYYDVGTGLLNLDSGGTAGVEAQDWLRDWDSTATGRGSSSSYFEGNIRTCADKGMRLPVAYETSMNNPGTTNTPNGDSGITPVWAGSVGVPNAASVGSGWTWTASAAIPGKGYYWVWVSSTNSSYQTYNYTGRAVRCVLPNNIPPWSDVTVGSDITMRDNATGRWWSNDRGAMIWDTAMSHCGNLSYNGAGAGSWRVPTDSELSAAYNNGINTQGRTGWITNFSPRFWSSVSNNTLSAWSVYLANGNALSGNKLITRQVVCVR